MEGRRRPSTTEPGQSRRTRPRPAQAVRRGVRRRRARASTPTSCTASPADRRGRARRRPGRRSSSAAATSSAAPNSAARHGPRPRRLHGHARHGHELPGPPGLPGEGRASTPACRPPSPWARSPSRTSRCAPSGTWRRAASSSSAPALGMPYFSTDTAAAQRALEIDADACSWARTAWTASTTADPQDRPRRASKLDALDYSEVARPRPQGRRRHRDHPVPGQRAADPGLRHGAEGNVARAVKGEKIGTLSHGLTDRQGRQIARHHATARDAPRTH